METEDHTRLLQFPSSSNSASVMASAEIMSPTPICFPKMRLEENFTECESGWLCFVHETKGDFCLVLFSFEALLSVFFSFLCEYVR